MTDAYDPDEDLTDRELRDVWNSAQPVQLAHPTGGTSTGTQGRVTTWRGVAAGPRTQSGNATVRSTEPVFAGS